MNLDTSVLVLNGSYEAINICNARRAVVLVLRGLAQSIENSDFYVNSPSFKMPVPEVIRLNSYINIPYKDVAFCRKNILFRDRFTCQYCNNKFPPDELTIDHIIPLSRGGADEWKNVVAACKRCNTVKGRRTPEEANMPLLSGPKKPHPMLFLHLVRHHGRSRPVWHKYLFY